GEWEDKIREDLKGADYEKKLIWETGEGFKVRPYYRAEDMKDLAYLETVPGNFPFVRSTKKTGNDWLIRQDILVGDIKNANTKALDLLIKGVNSLEFIFDPEFEPAPESIELLCENIRAEAVELNFAGCHNPLKMVQNIVNLVKKYNRNPEKILGSVDFDPLGMYALKGKFPVSPEASFDMAKQLIETSEYLPHLRVITVNGAHFHNSGSSITQELAFALAQGVEYLTQLTERGLTVDRIAPKIKFHFSVSSNYFPEIAKLRAARLLWAQIVKAWGGSEDACIMNIHSISSGWNKTVYDPHVNILRSTTEAMSSIISGTDSLTVAPFDFVFEKTTELSERIARNQQLLLKEESYFNKVVDPAAGSYYIENLTDSVAGEAWRLFLRVQDKGGFLAALSEGFIQDTVEQTAQERDIAIANRREILLGVNQYPNPFESLEKELESRIFEPDDKSDETPEIKTLKRYRGAQAFELMRYKTDRYALKNKRPKVFMLALGDPAMRRARALFSGNFFACAGFEINNNPVFNSADEAVIACIEAKADIAVICSSDEEYATLAPVIFEKLKEKMIVVVAGYPKAVVEELKQKGLIHFIHIRSNVVDSLTYFQKLLGIE
ncbi:MAG: methylmalonyl-CoA mutase small subunit, partial [Bacteroidetes bacterium]|nr:methylmalonyl-CoA mutase small subunit [Bacteroidota bacterium]